MRYMDSYTRREESELKVLCKKYQLCTILGEYTANTYNILIELNRHICEYASEYKYPNSVTLYLSYGMS